MIAALRERRPGVFADLRQKVMTECASRAEPMSFARKNFLSMIFDFVGDPSLEPATLAAIQASGAVRQGEQAPSARSGNIDAQSVVESMALPSQQAGV